MKKLKEMTIEELRADLKLNKILSLIPLIGMIPIILFSSFKFEYLLSLMGLALSICCVFLISAVATHAEIRLRDYTKEFLTKEQKP